MPVAAPVTTMVRLMSRSCVVMAFSLSSEVRLLGLPGCADGFNPDEPKHVKPGIGQRSVSDRAVSHRRQCSLPL